MGIYIVKTPKGEKLVQAKTKNGAINYASKGMFSATPVSNDELLKRIEAGEKVEKVETVSEEKPNKMNEALDKADAALKGAA